MGPPHYKNWVNLDKLLLLVVQPIVHLHDTNELGPVRQNTINNLLGHSRGSAVVVILPLE